MKWHRYAKQGEFKFRRRTDALPLTRRLIHHWHHCPPSWVGSLEGAVRGPWKMVTYHITSSNDILDFQQISVCTVPGPGVFQLSCRIDEVMSHPNILHVSIAFLWIVVAGFMGANVIWGMQV